MNKVIRYTVIVSAALMLSACKLGGMVEGLEGTLIVQEQESGEIIELNKSGPYAFESEFNDNDPYNVLILQQPEDSNNDCTVSKGKGDYTKDVRVNIHCQAPGSICTLQYDPVCALKSIPIQCVTTPCDPPRLYKTYGNSCQAKASGSEIAFKGECGTLEGKPEQEPVACTMEYSPVCAIDTTPIICIKAPCLPLRHYQTFSNTCSAESVNAEVILNQECGKLENKPVHSIEMLPLSKVRIEQGQPIQINSVDKPTDDLLTLSVSYGGGCGNHEFFLKGDTQFTGDDEALSDALFFIHKTDGDRCKAWITKELTFELSPLRKHYHKIISEEAGELELLLTAPNASPEAITYQRTYLISAAKTEK